MLYYVYKIENIVNHKKYIGLTNNINRRRSRHFGDLASKRHDNKFLQKEYDIFGKDNFSFEQIFCGDVDADEIEELEKYYIAYFDSYQNGYNQNNGGHFGPSNGGSKLTKTDILNILATTEFKDRSYKFLSDFFGVSKTTIMRIYRGDNHCAYYHEYHKMSNEQRYEIYNIFRNNSNLDKIVEDGHCLRSKRKLTNEQCLQVLSCIEFKKCTKKHLAKYFNVEENVIHLIAKRKCYKDVNMIYDEMTIKERKKYCDLVQ